jgi:hypothetical protein
MNTDENKIRVYPCSREAASAFIRVAAGFLHPFGLSEQTAQKRAPPTGRAPFVKPVRRSLVWVVVAELFQPVLPAFFGFQMMVMG